jgi:MFS family permease
MKLIKNHKELSLIISDARLRAIAIYTICSSFVLWYGIEKIFLKNTLNLTTTQIASLPLIYMITGLILEFPSSVLSDRWSRTKTLALSLVFLALSSIVGGLSRGYADYLIAAVLWSAASSFNSGTSEALLYDSLFEAGAKSKYLKISVFLKRLFGFSIFVATFIGGLMLVKFSPRIVYIFVVPTCVFGAVSILRVDEPSRHKLNQEAKIYDHISRTFRYIFKNKIILARLLVAALVIHIAVSYLYEFMPLSFLDIGTKESLVGPLASITGVLSYITLAGLVDKFKNKKWQTVLSLTAIVSVVSAFYINLIPLFMLVMMVAIMSYQYVTDINNTEIQHMISSSERASIGSVARLVAAALTLAIFWPLLNLSMNRLGDSGYLLVSGLVGFIVLILSLYIYFKEKRS